MDTKVIAARMLIEGSPERKEAEKMMGCELREMTDEQKKLAIACMELVYAKPEEKEYKGEKYIYSFYSAPIDTCPGCGKVKQLCGMIEEREWYNPVIKARSYTRQGCRVFDFMCRECLKKKQH